MGRLTMLRSLVLNLNAEYRWHSTIGVNGPPNRDHIWRDWSTTLFSESDDLCPWGGRNGLGFPALERLTLDFSEWQLNENQGLLVGIVLIGRVHLLKLPLGEAVPQKIGGVRRFARICTEGCKAPAHY